MDANFERAKGNRRCDRPEVDERRMAGPAATSWARARASNATSAWPRSGRCSSSGGCRTGSSRGWRRSRRPRRRAASQARQSRGRALVALLGAAIVAIAEFPDQVRQARAASSRNCCRRRLPDRAPVKAAPLARPELVDRGPALVPPCKPGHRDLPGALRLVHRAGTAGPSSVHPTRPARGQRLSRTVRLSSQSEIHPRRRSDACAALAMSNSPGAKTEPAPASVAGLRPTPVENFDGLPVGFARLTGVTNPGTGLPESDRIGLTCAACHTGQHPLQGRQRALRRRPGHGRAAQARERDRSVDSLHA